MNVQVNEENYEKYLSIVKKIEEKLQKIHQDTAGFSTSNHIFKHKQFKELVEMGDKLVNYIFHKITHDGGNWIYIHLLEEITKINSPKEIAGSFIHQTTWWLQWYINSQYYKENDIYYNLIY